MSKQPSDRCWIYIRSEPNLWTVGFYDPKGAWHSDSDHGNPAKAAQRVARLNGRTDPTDLAARLEAKQAENEAQNAAMERMHRELADAERLLKISTDGIRLANDQNDYLRERLEAAERENGALREAATDMLGLYLTRETTGTRAAKVAEELTAALRQGDGEPS